jgi:hypothetical protein
MSVKNGFKFDTDNNKLLVYQESSNVATFDNSSPNLTVASGATITAGDLTVTAGNIDVVAGTLDVQDGGAITQVTNKGTGVSLSTYSGQITTTNAALAAGVEVTFVVTNTLVAINDVVIVNVQSGGTPGEYMAAVTTVAAGSFHITLTNLSGSSASDAVILNFVVIKGAAS